MTLEEMRARLDALNGERRALHEAAGEADFTGEQQAQWDALDSEEDSLRGDIARAEVEAERAARVAESRARWGSAQVQVKPDAFAVLATGGYGASRQQLVDAALRANDGRIEDDRSFRKVMSRHAGDVAWAASVIARSRPEYAAGFGKVMRGDVYSLTSEERAAMAVGTATAGGML